MKDSEVVEKARETGGIGMIISEILCLFLLRKLHILLSPFSFSPACMALRSVVFFSFGNLLFTNLAIPFNRSLLETARS